MKLKQTRKNKYKALRTEIEFENMLQFSKPIDSPLVIKDDNPTYEQLEKALDKACKELSANEECITLNNYCHSEEEWKEWLLK